MKKMAGHRVPVSRTLCGLELSGTIREVNGAMRGKTQRSADSQLRGKDKFRWSL